MFTKTEKKGWPLLELSVKQVDQRGKKLRNGSAWVTWKQREIRKMLPKRIRSHFGLVAVGCVLLLAGCKAWDGALDTADKWWAAGGATLGIVRAAGDDIESVAIGAGILKGDDDATAPAAPAPGK